MKLTLGPSFALMYMLVIASSSSSSAVALRRIHQPTAARLAIAGHRHMSAESNGAGKPDFGSSSAVVSNSNKEQHDDVDAADDFEEPDILDFPSVVKRMSDDYGHMRFGKRNSFDDYGHMRFGKRNKDTEDEDYGHLRFGRR